jgi:fructosamine-3-kinase
MNQIFKKIEDWAEEKIVDLIDAYGGDIAKSQTVTLESGKKYFLKSASRNNKMFPCEANSLKELEKPGVIRVPRVFLVEADFLLIEYIGQGSKTGNFYENFGKQFAAMHRFKAKHFGFYEDNFIGHTPQMNIPDKNQSENWSTFYFEKRLLYQFKLAESRGLSSSSLMTGFKQLEAKIEDILKTNDAQPSLLHGDLWSGNYLADESGNPAIIDPGVYYGHREADLAMTKVFGGFPSSFYKAYNESYSLAEGYEYRENIYKLYHILNHLNLFGMSYHGQAVSLIQSYL